MKLFRLTFLLTILLLTGLVSAQKKGTKGTKVPAIRTITADFSATNGATKIGWRKCVGAGRVNEGLRADWQEQLRKVKKDCGFEYIRMHGLLHDDMGVYFEDKGKSIYNWQYIDVVYDFLLSIGIKPFVELSFMPKDLASGPETVFWWKGNITPPKDYNKWHDLIKALTEHFTERYGAEEVKTWYFEVWNEPNHPAFFKADQTEYFKLYEYTSKAIKAVNKDYKVGGPASAGNAWVREIIDYCEKQNVAIDFIATHTYSVIKGTFDETGKTGIQFNPDSTAVTKDVIKSRNFIQSSSKPNLELHYTEWSSSFSSSDPIHDTYQSAAFILDKIKGTEPYANSMSYWTFTDIFEEKGPRATPFHGGFGLLNYQSIKKPAYYAYQFLNTLGETELKNEDKASWICKNQQGDIQTLLWDFTITLPEDKVFNAVYYKRDLPAKDKGTVQLKYTNIAAGKYMLSVVKVGYKSNDIYSTYMQIGSPKQLTNNQVQALSEINSGKPIVNEIVEIKEDQLFNYQLNMRENDVYFVNLVKL
jgi:xylan 1,4-beta-xylosidase